MQLEIIIRDYKLYVKTFSALAISYWIRKLTRLTAMSNLASTMAEPCHNEPFQNS